MMRIRIALAFLLLVLQLPAPARAEEPVASPSTPASIDIRGWTKTQWGMTAEEVKAALGPEVRLYDGKSPAGMRDAPVLVLLQIDEFKIGSGTYRVFFGFDESSSKLARVSIMSTEKNHLIVEGHYDEIARLLTEKYGQPIYNQKKKDPRRFGELDQFSSMWKLPSTVIEMKYLYMSNAGGLTSLNVLYSPNTKERENIGL